MKARLGLALSSGRDSWCKYLIFHVVVVALVGGDATAAVVSWVWRYDWLSQLWFPPPRCDSRLQRAVGAGSSVLVWGGKYSGWARRGRQLCSRYDPLSGRRLELVRVWEAGAKV